MGGLLGGGAKGMLAPSQIIGGGGGAPPSSYAYACLGLLTSVNSAPMLWDSPFFFTIIQNIAIIIIKIN